MSTTKNDTIEQLDIMSELQEYMKHQQAHANNLRQQAGRLLNQADEADARAELAVFDATAIRDARLARDAKPQADRALVLSA